MASPSLLVPFELVEEILYKIPVSSLARFKSICKQWYALLNDKRFIYKHLELSKEQEGFIRLGHGCVQIFNPVTKTISGRLMTGPYDFGCTPQMSSMIHCDGLLLCTRSHSKLAVWNPRLSGVTWIEPSPSHSYNTDQVCGFGYGNASRGNYKVLRFHADYMYRNPGNKREVEIYDLKSKQWTSVGSNFDFYWNLHPYHQNVSMNGNMYWIAYRMTNTIQIFIQSFDFSSETFEPICCDVPVRDSWFHVTYGDQVVFFSGFM